ncbi:MAG: pleiotropic drug resistance ABC transporter [Circular genetic element sp.]|nr:MAG: pleiotropic drug resistance ABC transporter [Circular genetic element sp.]
METVEGVWCECYECKSDVHNQHEVDVFYTKNEYRIHRNERRLAYVARKNEKIIREAELKAACTKETEASEGHGRPSGVTTLFDLETGNMVPDPSIIGAVRWETLWRASIQED